MTIVTLAFWMVAIAFLLSLAYAIVWVLWILSPFLAVAFIGCAIAMIGAALSDI